MGFYNPSGAGGGGVSSFSGGPTGLTPSTPTSGAVVLGGTLGTGYGGTGNTATPTAGGAVYGDGTKYAITAAGTVGQFLQSNGASAPTWSTVSSAVGQNGYYASLYDDGADQVAASTTTAYAIRIGSSASSNGISVASNGTYLSRITFTNAGVYTLTPSIQFVNADTVVQTVRVWFRLNGSDIADSASYFDVVASHGGSSGNLIGVLSFTQSVTAGQYIEVMWSTSSTLVSIHTYAAGVSPTTPISPGVIVAVTSQPQIGLGYAGLTSTTSTTIGTGSKTFTVNLDATADAYVVGSRVRVANSVTPANFMEGVITAYSGTSLTVNVDSTGGSGTLASWNFSIAGIQGNSGLTVGTTTISGGTSGSLVYDNAGVVGETNTPALTNTVTGTAATTSFSLSPTWNTTGNPIGYAINATVTAVGDYNTSRLATWKVGGTELVGIDLYGNLWLGGNRSIVGWNNGISIYPGGAAGADPQFFIGQPATGTFGVFSRQAYVFGWAAPDSAAKAATAGIGWNANGVVEANTGTKGTLAAFIANNYIIAAATAPAAPTSGSTLYVDSADSTLKAKYASGNVVTYPTAAGTLLSTANFKIKIQTFTASGTYTPTAGLMWAVIEVVGGGGAGGGVQGAAAAAYGGGGGGGGGYARKVASAATIGASQTVTIGAGGTGVAAAAGGNGGTTSLGTLCVAAGGSGGGVAASTAAGGAGGSGTTGDILGRGGAGATPQYGSNVSGAVGGAGGSSTFGGGGVGEVNGTAGRGFNGYAAGGYGGGGAGADVYDQGGAFTYAGTNGTAGIVVVTEYYMG